MALPAPVGVLVARSFPDASAGSAGPAVWLVALGVALLPWLSPKGPGNSAPVDPVLALGVLGVLVWAVVAQARVHVPYALPVLALMVLGLVAAITGTAPREGGVAVLQEAFLLVWCAAVASVCRTPGALAVVVRAWVAGAAVWACVLVATAAQASGAAEGSRARLLFDHPNMAGNYFAISLFVLVACGWPRRRPARAAVGVVLLLAVLLTGSNAAFGSLAVGAVLTVFLHLRRSHGVVLAVAATSCLVLVGGTTAAVGVPPVLAAAQESEHSLVRYSIGRGARSAAARETLFASQYDLYERGDLLGLGPAATRDTLGTVAAPTAKEAHNDYLATLVERGPLGVLAVALLMGAVVARLVAVSTTGLRPAFDRVVPVPAALAGACSAFAVSALTHEVLHYRHLWAVLGVIAAVHLHARTASAADRRRGEPGVRPAARAM